MADRLDPGTAHDAEVALDPAAALDPDTVYRVYRGALALETASDRLVACAVVVLTGRLGLRPGELLHLHEGWIDWERGEVQVPAHDPCACELCWESARVAQRRGDPRPLAEIVAEDRWRGTARTVPFGWSRRLTGVLATTIDARDYLDRSAEQLRTLLARSAELATDVDPAALNGHSLRASAATCFADAGLDAQTLAQTAGLRLESAAALAAEAADGTRAPLADVVREGAAPDAAVAEAYPLVATHERLDAEPVDPADFDADWRRQRAAETGEATAGSPRPAVVPDGLPGEDADREPGAESTPPSADPATSDESETADADPLAALVTPPVDLVMHTRFACPSLVNGRPSGGRVVVGQSGVTMAAHGGGEITATTTVPFDGVRDVAIGWAPDRFESVFETTIGIAFRANGERDTAVIEIPDETGRDFLDALFEGALGELAAVVEHPATVGGRVTDAEPERCVLSVGDGHLDIAPAPGAEPVATIPLAEVIDVEPEAGGLAGGQGQAIAITYLEPGRQPHRTLVSPTSERDRTLLERYLLADHRRREQAALDAQVPDAQQEILEALHTTTGAKDLAKLLGLDRRELSERVEELAAAGFVHNSPDGVHLTGMGMLRTTDARADADG